VGGGGGEGTGGAGGAGGSGGNAPGCSAAIDAESGSGILFWSTLDDAAQLTTPRVGLGPGTLGGRTAFVEALSGAGIQLLAAGDSAHWPVTDGSARNISAVAGAIDFCVRPAADHDAGVGAAYLTVTRDVGTPFALVREADGRLAFYWDFDELPDSYRRLTVAPESSPMAAGSWYRLTAAWQFGGDMPLVALYLDGERLPPLEMDALPMDVPDELGNGAALHLGSAELAPGPGVIDELVIYGAPIVPSQ
jgi:hypothetical protein